ncbi:MAG: low molecular weight protein-tyrosine-phosphatase [Pseudomonadota bacterium]
MRLICVCRGNLCRSPMAAATLRAKAQAVGLSVSIDSAGAAPWHIGDPADPEAQTALERRGYDAARHRARRIGVQDFLEADLLLAMDSANHATLERLAPADATALIEPFHPLHDIFDPYYGGRAEFEAALDIIEEGADILVSRLLSAAETAMAAVTPRLHRPVPPWFAPSRRAGEDPRGTV